MQYVYTRAWSSQNKNKAIMTKEGSAKIVHVNFITIVDSCYYVDHLLGYIGYYIGNSKHKTILMSTFIKCGTNHLKDLEDHGDQDHRCFNVYLVSHNRGHN